MATMTKTKLQNFIDGEFVDPAEGQTEPVLNPATAEEIAEAPLSTEGDVNRAVEAARRAFASWADMPANCSRNGSTTSVRTPQRVSTIARPQNGT